MEVPSGVADPGVRVPLALPVVPGGAVEPVRLLLGQLQIQSAQPVDEGDETEEVHFHVGVHGDTEILLDRVIQQFHAAGVIGEIQRSVPASGHGKEHVPHQGSQTDGSAFFLYAAEDHGVAAHLGFLALAPVLPDEEDIDDLAAFDAGNGIQSPVDALTGASEGIQRSGVKVSTGVPVHAAQFIDGKCPQYGNAQNQQSKDESEKMPQRGTGGFCVMHLIHSFCPYHNGKESKRKGTTGGIRKKGFISGDSLGSS